MIRRQFVHTHSGAAAFAPAPRSGAPFRTAIGLDPAHPGVTIPPYLHGHFNGPIDGRLPLPELGSSASIPGRSLALASAHTRRDPQATRTIRLRDASAIQVLDTTIIHSAPHAHCASDAPHSLVPHSPASTVSDLEFAVHIAPASITKFKIELV